jgi:hypothetical protein
MVFGTCFFIRPYVAATLLATLLARLFLPICALSHADAAPSQASADAEKGRLLRKEIVTQSQSNSKRTPVTLSNKPRRASVSRIEIAGPASTLNQPSSFFQVNSTKQPKAHRKRRSLLELAKKKKNSGGDQTLEQDAFHHVQVAIDRIFSNGLGASALFGGGASESSWQKGKKGHKRIMGMHRDESGAFSFVASVLVFGTFFLLVLSGPYLAYKYLWPRARLISTSQEVTEEHTPEHEDAPKRSVASPAPSAGRRTRPAPNVRALVEGLWRSSAADVLQILPETGGSYDCAFSKPLSSGKLVRLEAHVEGPLHGSPLTAPLSGKPCVVYAASVTVANSRQPHVAPALPLASSQAHVDFVVTLMDAPHVRIEIFGEEAALFDMRGGMLSQSMPLSQAPAHWQEFAEAHTHACAAGAVARQREGKDESAPEQVMDFQEHALQVGTACTVVGELLRGPTGALSMRPLQLLRSGKAASGEVGSNDQKDAWRLSWERCGIEEEQVRISDDAQLLNSWTTRGVPTNSTSAAHSFF